MLFQGALDAEALGLGTFGDSSELDQTFSSQCQASRLLHPDHQNGPLGFQVIVSEQDILLGSQASVTPPAELVGAVSLLLGQKTHPALDAAGGWHPAMFLPHQPLLWSLFATLGVGMGWAW